MGWAEPVARVRGVGRKEQGSERKQRERSLTSLSVCLRALTRAPVDPAILHLPTTVKHLEIPASWLSAETLNRQKLSLVD